jgi:hypothetical protein
MQEVPVLQALLQFVRFGLPWDFGRTITIAHGDGRAVVSPPLSSPVFQRQQWSHEKLRRTGSRSEPGDDTANEKRRANSVQLRRSIPVQAGRAYEETYGGKLDCGHLSRRPPAAALRMRDEYAEHQRRWMQLSLIPRSPRTSRLEGRGARSGIAETSYAIALPAQGQHSHAAIRSTMWGYGNAGNTPAS